MTYQSLEDQERQQRSLMGLDRNENAQRQVAEYRRANAGAKAVDAMMQGGGVVDPPLRDEVERVLGRPSTSSAIPATDLEAVRAANADHIVSARAGAAPTVNPSAIAAANRAGVRVSTVAGTGAGAYAVTLEDVQAAAARQGQARTVHHLRSGLIATAAADARRVTRPSFFMPYQLVSVDEYGSNPLWEDIAQTNLDKAKAILAANDKPPTQFESGDLPVFTASGIAPSALAAVPWPVRHVIARLVAVDASQLLNKFTPGPTSKPAALAEEAWMFFADDDANTEYRSRIATWWGSWKPVYGPEGVTGYEKHDPTKGWRQ